MRLQPPQGTHLMSIEINDGGSGDALHSLKQKLPGEERGGEDAGRLEDIAPWGFPVGEGSGGRLDRLVRHWAKTSHTQNCVAQEKRACMVREGSLEEAACAGP